MRIHIKIEDLAGNAMIELLERNQCNEVSIQQLKDYGMAIVSRLNEKSEDEFFCIFSRDTVSSFVYDYANYFEVKNKQSEKFISLKPNVGIKELKDAFRSYLSVDMLIAFVSKESLRVLGIGN